MRYTTSLVAFVVLLAGGFSPAWAQDDAAALRAEVERLAAEVERLTQENQALRLQLAAFQDESEAETAQTQALVQELEVTREEVEDLRAERDTLQTLAALPTRDTAGARLTATYDAEADATVVASPTLPIPETRGLLTVEHQVGVSYQHAGEALAERPTELDVVIHTIENNNSRYRRLESITLIADGEAMVLPISGYEVLHTLRPSNSRRDIERINEAITVRMTYEQLRLAASATVLELQLRRRSYELTRDHAALFAAVLERWRETPSE